MTKSTRSSKIADKWTDGSKFSFNKSSPNKVTKTNRRLTMSPKKSLKQENMMNKRKSIVLRRLEIDVNPAALSPQNVRRTRRQSMLTLNTANKKEIPRAKSEKILPRNKSGNRLSKNKSMLKTLQVTISPIELKPNPVSENIKRRTTRSKITKRESMGKLTKIIPQNKSISSSTSKSNSKLLESFVENDLVTKTKKLTLTQKKSPKPKTRKTVFPTEKKSPKSSIVKKGGKVTHSEKKSPKLTLKKGGKVPLPEKQPPKCTTEKKEWKVAKTEKKSSKPTKMKLIKPKTVKVTKSQTPISSQKKEIASPLQVNDMEVQLAVSKAVSGSAKRKVKRLTGASPKSITRTTRSTRKVKIQVASPCNNEKSSKNSAIKIGSYLNDGSPNLSTRGKNLKPFTPKPDNPYDIVKNNMRKRITSRIDMMDISPERKNNDSFKSFASTPSSCSYLPPTPRSSRDSLYRHEKRSSIREYGKGDETPLSSTPKRGPALRRDSTFLSINESMDKTVVSYVDSDLNVSFTDSNGNQTNNSDIVKEKKRCVVM